MVLGTSAPQNRYTNFICAVINLEIPCGLARSMAIDWLSAMAILVFNIILTACLATEISIGEGFPCPTEVCSGVPRDCACEPAA